MDSPRDSRGNRQGQNQRPGGGVIFYNDEGIENGGLIFSGRRDTDGKIVDSGVSLSFDKYGVGGQMVQLAGVSDSANRFAGLRIKDTAVGGPNTNRVSIGHTDDGAASVALSDARGRETNRDGSEGGWFLKPDLPGCEWRGAQSTDASSRFTLKVPRGECASVYLHHR